MQYENSLHIYAKPEAANIHIFNCFQAIRNFEMQLFGFIVNA